MQQGMAYTDDAGSCGILTLNMLAHDTRDPKKRSLSNFLGVIS